MTPHAEVRAVTFDVGGTLLQPWPSVGHVYAEIAAKHGLKIPADVLDRNFSKAWRENKNFTHTRGEWAALVDKTFAGLCEPPPSGTFFPELYERFAQPDAWRIFDDVLAAIDMLAARDINLAIISNWDERLRPLLDKLGLTKYFERIIVSCEVGFTKPSPVIFEQASKWLGTAQENILHVGDSLEHDVKGAANAGYQTRWLRRGVEILNEGSIGTLLELDDF